MAALHAPVDCAWLLQEKHRDLFQNLETITSVKIEMGGASFKKKDGNWTQTKSNLQVHRWMLLMQLQCNSSIKK